MQVLVALADVAVEEGEGGLGVRLGLGLGGVQLRDGVGGVGLMLRLCSTVAVSDSVGEAVAKESVAELPLRVPRVSEGLWVRVTVVAEPVGLGVGLQDSDWEGVGEWEGVDRVREALLLRLKVDSVAVNWERLGEPEAVAVAEDMEGDGGVAETLWEGEAEAENVAVGTCDALRDGDIVWESVTVEREREPETDRVSEVGLGLGLGAVPVQVLLGAEGVSVGEGEGLELSERELVRLRVRSAKAEAVAVVVGLKEGEGVQDTEKEAEDTVAVGVAAWELEWEVVEEQGKDRDMEALREAVAVREGVAVVAEGVQVLVALAVKVPEMAVVGVQEPEAEMVCEGLRVADRDGGEGVEVHEERVGVVLLVAVTAGVGLVLPEWLREADGLRDRVPERDAVGGRLYETVPVDVARVAVLREGERLQLREGVRVWLALGAVQVVLGVGGVCVAVAEGGVGVCGAVTVRVRVRGAVEV